MQQTDAILATHQFRAQSVRMKEQEPTDPYGKLIRAARLRKGWDGDTLGQALGRDKGWVSREELGRRNLPDVTTYRALCAALDLPLRALLEAKGYLDPEELEPGVAYEIREGDPRKDLLDVVRDAPPLRIGAITDLARLWISRSTNEGNAVASAEEPRKQPNSA